MHPTTQDDSRKHKNEPTRLQGALAMSTMLGAVSPLVFLPTVAIPILSILLPVYESKMEK